MTLLSRISSTPAAAALRNISAPLAERGKRILDLGLEVLPIVGKAATRRRKRIVLAPYARVHTLPKSLMSLFGIPLLIFICLIYGFFFALTAPYLIVQFVAPLLILVALIIWCLPDQRTAPTLPIEYLFAVFFIFHGLWPEYLAISLPHLPWITFERLVGLPMTGLLLVCLSVSAEFRKRISESVTSIKPMWYFFCGFIVVQLITTVLSRAPNSSANQVFNQQIYWTSVFIISCFLFRKIEFIERYWSLLIATGAILVAVTFWESQAAISCGQPTSPLFFASTTLRCSTRCSPRFGCT